MIQQDFPIPMQSTKRKSREPKNHIWEVRHAGLLGIKYEVAVRGDLFDRHAMKQEEESVENDREVLRGVVAAAILGYVMLRISNFTYLLSPALVTATTTSAQLQHRACYL
jgi:hypothetical protein